MAASLLSRRLAPTTRSFITFSRYAAARLCSKTANTIQVDTLNSKEESSSDSKPGESALAGFAKALEKARGRVEVVPERADDVGRETDHQTFAEMLRYSKLVQLGDYEGRMVLGTVFEVVGDDLYIDIGGKFHCVCPRPKLNSDRYSRGAKVKVRVTDLEMSSSFLGSDGHVTLLEADGTLTGLRRQPVTLRDASRISLL